MIVAPRGADRLDPWMTVLTERVRVGGVAAAVGPKRASPAAQGARGLVVGGRADGLQVLLHLRPESCGQPYIGVTRASSTLASSLEISVVRCERSVIVSDAIAADSFPVTTS